MTTRYPVVLIVEDDPATREMYRSALRMAGLSLVVAADGVAALHQIDEAVPDVVVLDLDIPHVNGIAILEELAASPRTAGIPVLVVTGTDWQLPRAPAAVLPKPVAPDTLVARVRDLVRRRV